MTGDCHVRFCESLGLQRPGPLTKKVKKTKRAKRKRASSGKQEKRR
jgi:hypothetical protein